MRSIRVDSEGAKHLFSLGEKRHFAPKLSLASSDSTITIYTRQKDNNFFPCVFLFNKSFLADTKSNESALNLCFTTPVTFNFYKFVPSTLQTMYSTLNYCVLIDVGIVHLDGQLPH